MYRDTITLFNRYKSSAGDVWYPTIIHGVDLNMDRAAILAKYGDSTGDSARLHIRFSVSMDDMNVSDNGDGHVSVFSRNMKVTDTDGDVSVEARYLLVADDGEGNVIATMPRGSFVGDKLYLPPKEWAAQEDSDLVNSVTFNSGSDFDFFIVGEWEDTEPIQDRTYLDGFYQFANTRFDYVFAITSVAMYSVIPHFEIMAR